MRSVMRSLKRPLMGCTGCGAKLYNWMSPPEKFNGGEIEAAWSELPGPTAPCPRCGNPVDTTNAYLYLPDFPPSFDLVKKSYDGFTPQWEHNRESFELAAEETLEKLGVAQFETDLNTDGGRRWYRQRMFYRSAAAFYRSLQLFLGYLTLDRHCYGSWATVTGYYSRFYFIQAFLNLLLSTFLNLNEFKLFVYFDGNRIVCVEQGKLPKAFRKGPHQMWWSLMEALKAPNYPIEELHFILSRLVFNSEKRDTTNYDYQYLGGGFIELEWFDSGAMQMLSHFMPHPRADEDITNMDRFFAGCNPENVDPGDFYADDAQIIWRSLIGYMQLLKGLDFKQQFLMTETIAALSELHIGTEYPTLLQGIVLATAQELRDGFDVKAFANHYASSEHPDPFFAYDGSSVKSRLFAQPRATEPDGLK